MKELFKPIDFSPPPAEKKKRKTPAVVDVIPGRIKHKGMELSKEIISSSDDDDEPAAKKAKSVPVDPPASGSKSARDLAIEHLKRINFSQLHKQSVENRGSGSESDREDSSSSSSSSSGDEKESKSFS